MVVNDDGFFSLHNRFSACFTFLLFVQKSLIVFVVFDVGVRCCRLLLHFPFFLSFILLFLSLFVIFLHFMCFIQSSTHVHAHIVAKQRIILLWVMTLNKSPEMKWEFFPRQAFDLLSGNMCAAGLVCVNCVQSKHTHNEMRLCKTEIRKKLRDETTKE